MEQLAENGSSGQRRDSKRNGMSSILRRDMRCHSARQIGRHRPACPAAEELGARAAVSGAARPLSRIRPQRLVSRLLSGLEQQQARQIAAWFFKKSCMRPRDHDDQNSGDSASAVHTALSNELPACCSVVTTHTWAAIGKHAPIDCRQPLNPMTTMYYFPGGSLG